MDTTPDTTTGDHLPTDALGAAWDAMSAGVLFVLMVLAVLVVVIWIIAKNRTSNHTEDAVRSILRAHPQHIYSAADLATALGGENAGWTEGRAGSLIERLPADASYGWQITDRPGTSRYLGICYNSWRDTHALSR